MRIQPIIASDFSGMLEGIYIGVSGVLLLLIAITAVALSFVPNKRLVARKLVLSGAVIILTQLLAFVSYIGTVPAYRQKDELRFFGLVLIPVTILGIAYLRSKRSSDNGAK